ncbi:hypothetical protein GVX86_10620, partial [[Haemophilus] felis]|nr:hypothetical protein [[Haemophilus] felis]
ARNHGLLNISTEDFFKTTLIFPISEQEQQKIGTFFTALDRLITTHQRKFLLYKVNLNLIMNA